MADPVSNHLVSGTVYDIFGTKLEGVTVTLTHATIKPVLTALTDSDGKYVLNLGSLDEEWAVGQTISVKGFKTAEGTKTSSVAISTQEPQTVNLTLAETSDFVFDDLPQDRTHLYMNMLTHYDGEKITRERPLPVVSTDGVDLVYNPERKWTITNQDGQPDDETVTFADGTVYKRNFTYSTVQGNRVLTKRTKWVRQ